jgi:hypothetical protein
MNKIKGIVYRVVSVLTVLVLIFSLVAFLIPTPTYAAGNTYYVAKTGNNSNIGDETYPWLTIQKAATTMVAGDTVYIKAGTYNEQVVPANSGSSGGGYITYANYGTDEVIISGTGLGLGTAGTGAVAGLFYCNAKSYIKLEASSAGKIQIYDSHINWIFRPYIS